MPLIVCNFLSYIRIVLCLWRKFQLFMPKFFKNNKKSLIAFGTCLLFIVCLVIANFIASSVLSAGKNVSEVKSSAFDLYMISLAKSQVKSEALSLSADYQKIGAGGYIWEQDGYFHVISSAYSNKNDAILVQNSVKAKGIENSLINVHFNGLSINGNFTDNEGKVLNKALNSFQNYYHSLYDIAISYDTSVYNEISARLAVNNSHSTLSSLLADFETIFEDACTASPLKNLHSALNDALSISKDLCSGVPVNAGQTYSSLIKYHYLKILDIYLNLSAK